MWNINCRSRVSSWAFCRPKMTTKSLVKNWLLLMEDIRLTNWYGKYLMIYRVSYTCKLKVADLSPQNMLGKYSAIDICPGFGGFGSGPNLQPWKLASSWKFMESLPRMSFFWLNFSRATGGVSFGGSFLSKEKLGVFFFSTTPMVVDSKGGGLCPWFRVEFFKNHH